MTSTPTYDARFVVTGTPIPYARARTVRLPGGGTRYYTDKRSAEYRSRVAREALHASRWMNNGSKLVRRSPTWAGPSECLKVATKLSARRKGKALPKCGCRWCGTEYRLKLFIVLPDRRVRDEDNIEKNLLDACTGILWWDDRQAFVEAKSRVYSKANPRVEVWIRIVAGQEALTDLEEGPFGPDGGWETERAREWLSQAKRFEVSPGSYVGNYGAVADDLAALLRDCWASGFLEGSK